MRLIDADKIEYTHAIARCIEDGHNWNELCVTKDDIEEEPTVDAVPVIRCKDCKWYYRGGATCMYWDGENDMCGDDYCSRAERRKDDRR